ncbi:MAG: hypothetical protein WCS37_13025 [Chloroflexota bacterium]|nr:hypothetical protein [Chloroflexota bacterium]
MATDTTDAPNVVQQLIGINDNVVRAAEGIVSKVSPPLARTLVEVDGTFKKLYVGLIKGYFGLVKGVLNNVLRSPSGPTEG